MKISTSYTVLCSQLSELAHRTIERIKGFFGRFTCSRVENSEANRVLKIASDQPSTDNASLQDKKATAVQPKSVEVKPVEVKPVEDKAVTAKVAEAKPLTTFPVFPAFPAYPAPWGRVFGSPFAPEPKSVHVHLHVRESVVETPVKKTTETPVKKKEPVGRCRSAANLLGRVARGVFYGGARATACVTKNLAYAGGYTVGGTVGAVVAFPFALTGKLVDSCIDTQLGAEAFDTGIETGGTICGTAAYAVADGTCSLVKGGFNAGAAIAQGGFNVGTGLAKGAYGYVFGGPLPQEPKEPQEPKASKEACMDRVLEITLKPVML